MEVFDRHLKTVDMDVESIVQDFLSDNYDGSKDDILKQLFMYVRYPLTDVNSNQIGFIQASDMDQAKHIISLLELQQRISTDDMTTMNIFRMYDKMAKRKNVLQATDKLYMFNAMICVIPDEVRHGEVSGIVIAKDEGEARERISEDIEFEILSLELNELNTTKGQKVFQFKN